MSQFLTQTFHIAVRKAKENLIAAENVQARNAAMWKDKKGWENALIADKLDVDNARELLKEAEHQLELQLSTQP